LLPIAHVISLRENGDRGKLTSCRTKFSSDLVGVIRDAGETLTARTTRKPSSRFAASDNPAT